jgi:HSP20 family molecular chaperone IbpA
MGDARTRRVYLRFERSSSEFMRVIDAAMGLDAKETTATYEHGLLTLRVPKAPQEKPTVIPINKREPVAALN